MKHGRAGVFIKFSNRSRTRKIRLVLMLLAATFATTAPLPMDESPSAPLIPKVHRDSAVKDVRKQSTGKQKFNHLVQKAANAIQFDLEKTSEDKKSKSAKGWFKKISFFGSKRKAKDKAAKDKESKIRKDQLKPAALGAGVALGAVATGVGGYAAIQAIQGGSSGHNTTAPASVPPSPSTIPPNIPPFPVNRENFNMLPPQPFQNSNQFNPQLDPVQPPYLLDAQPSLSTPVPLPYRRLNTLAPPPSLRRLSDP